nr:hypothetical protein [Phytophthora castaneae RNA virus 1]
MLRYADLYGDSKSRPLFDREGGGTEANDFPAMSVLRNSSLLAAKVRAHTFAPQGQVAWPAAAGSAALPFVDTSTTRVGCVRIDVQGVGVGGPSEGVGAVSGYLDRRHVEDTTSVSWTNAVRYGAADAASMDTATVHRSVRNLLVGIGDVEARQLVNDIATLEDGVSAYTPVYFRLFALAEAIACGERVTNVLQWDQTTVWPTGAADWTALVNHVWGIVSGAEAGSLLDASCAPMGVSAGGLACLIQSCMPYLGVTADVTGDRLGLARYCGEQYRLVIYGSGLKRPAAGPAFSGAQMTVGFVCEAINFVLQCTGDSEGLETALRFAASRTRHLGPEVQHLPSSLEGRLHHIPPQIEGLGRVFWGLVQGYEHQAWPAGLAGWTLGLWANWQPRYQMAPPAVGTAVPANLASVGAGFVELARRAQSWSTFVGSLTTTELIEFLSAVRGFDPWPWLNANWAGHQGQAPPRWAAAAEPFQGAWYYTTRGEASLPSDGMDGTFTLAGATGLGHLKRRMASMGQMVPRRRNPVPSLTGDQYLRGLGLLSMAVRSAADVAVHAGRVSRTTRQLATGAVAGLDQRLEAILARRLDGSVFDNGSIMELCQVSVSYHLRLEWWQRPGVEVLSATVPDYQYRQDEVVCAAVHPTLRSMLLGAVGGPGGAIQPRFRDIANRAGGYPWDGELDETLSSEHVMGAVSLAAWNRGLVPSYELVAHEKDADLRREYTAVLQFPGSGAVRPSDAAPHVLGGGVPAAWWMAVPVKGAWRIGGWQSCARPSELRVSAAGRGATVAKAQMAAPNSFGVAHTWAPLPSSLRPAWKRLDQPGAVPAPMVWDSNDPESLMYQVLGGDRLDRCMRFCLSAGFSVSMRYGSASPQQGQLNLAKLWEGEPYRVPPGLQPGGASPEAGEPAPRDADAQ